MRAILLFAVFMAGAFSENVPMIDNELVTVWDVTWDKVRVNPVQGYPHDSVSVYLAAGPIKITRPNGRISFIPKHVGEVVFEPKGTQQLQEGTASDHPARSIVIAFKDHPMPPPENTSGYPNAFPRPGAKKIFENYRILVWDYTWMLNVPTKMHFHDKDVVVVYMENGALKSTTPDGQSVTNENSFGLTKFNARNRLHAETLIRGKGRAIVVEMK
jgi:hypothetical protein